MGVRLCSCVGVGVRLCRCVGEVHRMCKCVGVRLYRGMCVWLVWGPNKKNDREIQSPVHTHCLEELTGSLLDGGDLVLQGLELLLPGRRALTGISIREGCREKNNNQEYWNTQIYG